MMHFYILNLLKIYVLFNGMDMSCSLVVENYDVGTLRWIGIPAWDNFIHFMTPCPTYEKLLLEKYGARYKQIDSQVVLYFLDLETQLNFLMEWS